VHTLLVITGGFVRPSPRCWAGRHAADAAQWRTATPPLQPMTIDISKDARKEAVTSIERYFKENMEERIGNIAAGALLNFFLEEIGPVVYNQAVADVQERLQARVAEVDIEIHEDAFTYWRKFDRERR